MFKQCSNSFKHKFNRSFVVIERLYHMSGNLKLVTNNHDENHVVAEGHIVGLSCLTNLKNEMICFQRQCWKTWETVLNLFEYSFVLLLMKNGSKQQINFEKTCSIWCSCVFADNKNKLCQCGLIERSYHTSGSLKLADN